jgi:hypothetical protein
LHGNTGGFLEAQAQAEISQSNLHGAAKQCEPQHFDFFSFDQAHFQKTLNHGIIAGHGIDAATLAESHLIQGRHEGLSLYN